MANCVGKAAGIICGGILKKCAKCGVTGCTNVRNGEKCTNNITRDSGGTCKNCGGQLKTL